MKRVLAMLLMCLMLVAIECVHAADTNPVKLIFDTDIGNDIDDALALAMIHVFADRGEAELLAVTVSKDNPWATVYVDIVNRFYGRPNIPIGVVRNGKTPDDGYVRNVAERRAGGRFVYDRGLKSGLDAPEAVGLLRQTLAAQADGSVVVVSVGFMTNLARLLDSPPDQSSLLDGKELVRRKVRLYVMMGGAYEQPSGPEYNVCTDLDAARKVFEQWPTPIVASGFEVGSRITYPAESIERDFGYVPNHPIAEAYRVFSKMPYDRPTWDLTAVLYAVRPDRGYFGLSPQGSIAVNADGTTSFSPDAQARCQFLTVNTEQAVRVREAFTWIVPSPPKCGRMDAGSGSIK